MRHYIPEYVKAIETFQNVFQVFSSKRLLANANLNTVYSRSSVTYLIHATSNLNWHCTIANRWGCNLCASSSLGAKPDLLREKSCRYAKEFPADTCRTQEVLYLRVGFSNQHNYCSIISDYNLALNHLIFQQLKLFKRHVSRKNILFRITEFLDYVIRDFKYE
jgi:hypothetical protein